MRFSMNSLLKPDALILGHVEKLIRHIHAPLPFWSYRTLTHIKKCFEVNDLAQLRNSNYYNLLGVNRDTAGDAFSRAITTQYRQLALRFHPDLYQNDLTKTEIFKLINEAYSTLSNTEKRRAYDSSLSETERVATNSNAFFHAAEHDTPLLPTERYCFFHAKLNDWHAFGWEADITVENKRSNSRFTLSGHILPVKSLVFSQNERFLASVDMNRVIKIWDLSSRQCIQTFTANTRRVTHLFFTDNSEWLITGKEDVIFNATREIEVWDFKNGKYLGLFSGFYELGRTNYGNDSCSGSGITHLAISPDGKVVPGTKDAYLEKDATETNSSTVVAKDENGNPVHFVVKRHLQATTGCTNEIIVPIWPDSVAKPTYLHGYEFNASKSHVLVREKLAVTLWDLRTESLLASIKVVLTEEQKKEDCRVTCAFNPINHTFAVALDNHVRIMDYQGREQQQFTGPDVIRKLHFTPDRKWLISQRRRSVFVHDCETGRSYALFNQPIRVNDVAISPDSQKIMVTTETATHNTLRIFETKSQKCLFQHVLQFDGVKDPNLIYLFAEPRVFQTVFSPDSQTMALGLDDKSVRVINMSTFDMGVLRGHRNDVLRVAFSPDNRWLVSASRDNTICIWDFRQRRLVQQFNSGYTTHIIFVNDHRFIFNSDKQIKTWDIMTRKMDDVCCLPFREEFEYADRALFFEDQQGLLTKIDISAVLRRFENQASATALLDGEPSLPASSHRTLDL